MQPLFRSRRDRLDRLRRQREQAVEAAAKRSDLPSGGSQTCPGCGRECQNQELVKTEYVCPHCGYHLPIGAYLRLSLLLDPFTFQELWPELTAPNVLDFPGYEGKLTAQREKTALSDAAVAAVGKLDGRQAVFAVLGTTVMFIVSRFNYQRLRGAGKILLYISLFLLVIVLIPGIGQLRNGARRWIGLGVLTFQPSEIAKVAIVVYFAGSISRKKEQMQTFRYGIVPYAFILVLTAGLVGKEPHLSGALLILGAGAAMMLVGGINWRWVFAAIGAVGAMAYVVLFIVGYNTSRVTYWLDPWADAGDKGYQLSQSLITIGSGGLWGLGLGKSRQKFLFLPEEHNDFIFAIVCEELGLIGACVIMLLFAALVLRGYWIALHTRDRFGALLVVGIITLIAMQVFLNIAVVTGMLPTTGIPLPFFSYGGTALCIQLAEMGIVLSVSRQMKPTKAG